MDVTIKRSAFIKPLQAISGIVEKKQTMPILSNVLLHIDQQRVHLSATDLEIELIGHAPLETVSAAGTATVSARKLFDICRALPDEAMLNLSLKENYLALKSGDSCYRLSTLPVQDFPRTEESALPTQFILRSQTLKNLLSKIYFAMGLQDVRHYLNGALFHIQQNAITCVATDGHRLAITTHVNEQGNCPPLKIILPRKSVIELMRLLNSDEDKELMISVGEGRFRIIAPDFTFTSKLINTQYPEYNKLIPRGAEVAIANRENIRQALMRAAILCNEKFRGVRVQLEPGKLIIIANNTEQEQAQEIVPIEYAGSAMDIGFNVTYLLDVFASLSSEMVRCTFTDPNSGVLIESPEGDGSRYVVMPMRL